MLKLSAGNTIIFISLQTRRTVLTPLKSLLPCSPKETSYKLLIQQSIQRLNLPLPISNSSAEDECTCFHAPRIRGCHGHVWRGQRLTVPSSLLRLAMFQDLPIGEAITAFAGVDPGVEQSGGTTQRATKLPNVEPAGSVRPCSGS